MRACVRVRACERARTRVRERACACAQTVYTDWEQHMESVPHKQMIIRVERNETPEAQAFTDFFGLPHDGLAQHGERAHQKHVS